MVHALILDLGDVLFNWDAPKSTLISRKTLGQMLHSDIWGEYECGRLTENESYTALARRYNCNAQAIAETFSLARESLRLDTTFMAFLQDLKQRANGALRVYGMSNISKPDYEILLSKADDWSLFDKIFPSGHVGIRKPDLAFFRHVLREISTASKDIVFVDDSLENVTSARSLGMHAIVFKEKEDVQRRLQNLFGSPTERGMQYLSSNKTMLQSVTTTNVPVLDNFGQLLILEATRDPELVRMEPGKRTWNFFIGPPNLTTERFPDDLDTTSLALSIIPTSPDIAASVMDEIVSRLNEDGIVPTYFDRTRPRVDPIVCVNVLSLFARYGREEELAETISWVRDILYHRAYLAGTRYYASPEAFLFFFTRFTGNLRPGPRKQELRALLYERVQERTKTPVDSLALSMRILACLSLGIESTADVSTLIGMQSEDGGWPPCVIYKYGAGGLGITNRGVSTAFAVKAIAGCPTRPDASSASSSSSTTSTTTTRLPHTASLSPEWRSVVERLQPLSHVGDWVVFLLAFLRFHLAWLYNVALASRLV